MAGLRSCGAHTALAAAGVCVVLLRGALAQGASQVRAGFGHSCALTVNGVRCWGLGDLGQLGYGNVENVGDNEYPYYAGIVNVGAPVTGLSLGSDHTCALLQGGAVRCWGSNFEGQLGYDNLDNDIGDDEAPASAGNLPLGVNVTQVAAGESFTCVLTTSGSVRCFGFNDIGQLGNGDTVDRGASAALNVNLGGTVSQVVAGASHACALLTTGAVRCWGDNLFGQLGYGHTHPIGDDETPAAASSVNVGGTVTELAAGFGHTCALLTTGAVRCWGDGFYGQLGYGSDEAIGDDESPASAGDISIGGTATLIVAGGVHTCARLSTSSVRCWGDGMFGKLGQGNEAAIGDDELPSSVPIVQVGLPVTQVAAGGDHTCALVVNGSVRCWGLGIWGQLGYANTASVGGVATPARAGSVLLESAPAIQVPLSASGILALGVGLLALGMRRVRAQFG